MPFRLFTRQCSFKALLVATIFGISAILHCFTQYSTGQDIDNKRFKIQAKRMLALYDLNKDGYLSQSEIEDLEGNEVRAPRFDVDKDNRLSMDELVDAISRKSSAKVDGLVQPPSAAAGSNPNDSSNLEVVEMYRRFLDASMKKNDKNQDGTIDAKEIASARWSSPWRDSDLDGDGNLTRNEMQKRYEKMFGVSLEIKGGTKNDDDKIAIHSLIADGAVEGGIFGDVRSDGSGGVLGPWKKQEQKAKENGTLQNPTFFFLKHRKADQMLEFLNDYFLGIKPNPASNAQAQQVISMMRAMSGGRSSSSSRKGATSSGANSANTILEGNVRLGVDKPLNSIYVIGATLKDLEVISELIDLMDRPPSNSGKEVAGKDAAVNMEIYLIRAPRNASSEIVANAVKNIESSKSASVANDVASVAKSLGVKEYDRLALTTTMGSMSKINSASSVPKMKQAIIDPRARQSASRQQSTHYGLKAQLTPMVGENCVKVAIELEKNDAFEASDDNSALTELVWSFQSIVHVEHGKPTVVASTSALQNWILVVNVK